jgi:glycosyltransferase involved in cell wall biosynthesis
MRASAADRGLVRFSVVIPTMNRTQLLRETLESLRACDPCPDEVIVIDADSEESARDVTADFDNRFPSPVRYIRSKPSLAVQRNLGIAQATGEVIVFLDDDVELEPPMFALLQRAYWDESIVGATGRVIEPEIHKRANMHSVVRRFLPGGGKEGSFTRYGYPRYVQRVDVPRDVEYMLGCFMSARREAARRVGFDEQLGGYALAEDEDFSFRLSRVGRIRYVPEIVVHHRKLGFNSKDTRAFGRLVVQNRWYLFRKNFDDGLLAKVQFGVLIGLLLIHRVVNREWRGARGVLEGAAELAFRRR